MFYWRGNLEYQGKSWSEYTDSVAMYHAKRREMGNVIPGLR